MDYRAKAINCVKDTALPVQMQWFRECNCNLDTYCQKYGETEFFFAKVIEKGHIYEMGYPKCVCPEALAGGKEASFCECSRQGMIYVLENMMPQKHIKVETIETVLSGAEKCRFRVSISLNIAETFELLFDKNNNVAYKALQELQEESIETDCFYPYMDRLSDMLDSDNSYIRTRGLTLIAYNAKWDKDYKIDEIIDNYLKHITDVKPITARQCIKMLPIIAKDKPELRNDILSALHEADICIYDDSMKSLVYKDIQEALRQIDR